LLTKVGVYALLRTLIGLMPATRDTLDPVLTGVAALTLILAPMGAIAQTNLRRSLGFLVIGGIGAVMAGLAMPTLRGVAGATIYAFHSILTMTALYLVAGLIERITRETDTRAMGGVYKASSPLSIMFIILVFAVAGLPPFLGFWPKILLVEASLEDAAYLLTVCILLNSLLTAIAGTRLWSHIFWRIGREGEQSEQPNDRIVPLNRTEAGWGLVPTGLLVVGIMLIGLWPNPLFEAGRNAAIQLLQTDSYISAVGIEVTP
jgi:multicomponent Na+:H+ antiporter subunit D